MQLRDDFYKIILFQIYYSDMYFFPSIPGLSLNTLHALTLIYNILIYFLAVSANIVVLRILVYYYSISI